MTTASRIGVIRDGVLVQAGTPREIDECPNDIYVATRLGSPQTNLIAADLLPEIQAPSGTKTIGVRTEHLEIATPNGAGPAGKVRRVEHLGDRNYVHIEFKGQGLVTLADPHRPLAPDQEVGLSLNDPLYFDAARGESASPQSEIPSDAP